MGLHEMDDKSFLRAVTPYLLSLIIYQGIPDPFQGIHYLLVIFINAEDDPDMPFASRAVIDPIVYRNLGFLQQIAYNLRGTSKGRYIHPA